MSLASVGTLLERLKLTAQKLLERAYQRDPEAIARWQCDIYPGIVRQAKKDNAEIYVWDESGFRADCVYGKTWGVRGHTSVVNVLVQRQSVSAASAVNSKGTFWYAVYTGGSTGDKFVGLLRELMAGRDQPLHLIVDGLPAHKAKVAWEYVDSLEGQLTLHFLQGNAPDLNPDELVWIYAKRTGVARSLLYSGEELMNRVRDKLAEIAARLDLVCSFFRHPSVAYIPDW